MNTQQPKRTATSQYVKDSTCCQSPGQLGALRRLGISGKYLRSTESVSNSSLRRRWLSRVFISVAMPWCQAMQNRLRAKPSSKMSKAKAAKELTHLDMHVQGKMEFQSLRLEVSEQVQKSWNHALFQMNYKQTWHLWTKSLLKCRNVHKTSVTSSFWKDDTGLDHTLIFIQKILCRPLMTTDFFWIVPPLFSVQDILSDLLHHASPLF